MLHFAGGRLGNSKPKSDVFLILAWLRNKRLDMSMVIPRIYRSNLTAFFSQRVARKSSCGGWSLEVRKRQGRERAQSKVCGTEQWQFVWMPA